MSNIRYLGGRLRLRLPTSGEIAESEAKCVPSGWVVDEGYTVQNGILRPLAQGRAVGLDEDRVITRVYRPILETIVPAEFAKVAQGSEPEVIRFACRYGLLGYRETRQTSLDVYREQLSMLTSGEIHHEDLEKFYFDDEAAQGDPVSWILGHACGVSLALELAGLDGDLDRLKHRIDQLITPADSPGKERLSFAAGVRGCRRPTLYHFGVEQDCDPRSTARSIISTIVNDNLAGVTRRLTWGADRATSTFEPASLLDAIYWLLADAVIGHSVKQCGYENCRRFFVARNPKMEFCPSPAGDTISSRCASRHRQQQYRKNQKSQKSRNRSRRA
jgi:hypothetical protein